VVEGNLQITWDGCARDEQQDDENGEFHGALLTQNRWNRKRRGGSAFEHPIRVRRSAKETRSPTYHLPKRGTSKALSTMFLMQRGEGHFTAVFQRG